MSLRDRLIQDDLISTENRVTDVATASYIFARRAMLGSDAWGALMYSASTLPKPYISNWRILHIDGFEAGFRLVRYRFSVRSFVRKAQPAV